MERRTKILVGLVSIVVFITGLIAAGSLIYVNQPSLIMTGTLYFNDSGEHHGGFEMAMQWNVTLFLKENSGQLVVTPEPGYMCNDVLLKWSYSIVGFQISEQNITMAIDSHPVVLEFVENDTIWNRYHNQYISATPDLSPTIFPGFISHYYVEFRLAQVPL
ncbi:MAG: hypothetical protein ACFFDU_04540 [Candidatus Thorarchaeota archaeon]